MRRTTYKLFDGTTTVDYSKAIATNKKFETIMIEIKDDEMLSEKNRKKKEEWLKQHRERLAKEREIEAINKMYDEMYHLECEV